MSSCNKLRKLRSSKKLIKHWLMRIWSTNKKRQHLKLRLWSYRRRLKRLRSWEQRLWTSMLIQNLSLNKWRLQETLVGNKQGSLIKNYEVNLKRFKFKEYLLKYIHSIFFSLSITILSFASLIFRRAYLSIN